jgi:hypothetical protein
MVCYVRPASWLAAIAVVAFLILGRPVGHFLDTAAVAVALTVVIAGAAVATALVLAALMSSRRRRAVAGGCVSCQFRCQHAMTESSRRSWLVTTVDRRAPIPAPVAVAGHLAATPGRPAPVFLPMPSVGPARPDTLPDTRPDGWPGGRGAAVTAVTCGSAAPRWPDRPARRPVTSQPGPRERAGSAA